MMTTFKVLLIFALITLLPNTYSISAEQNDDIEIIAKNFVDTLVKNDFVVATESFDPTMKNAMPSETLKKTWDGLIRQTGQFKEQKDVKRYDLVEITCDFEKQKINVRIFFDKDKKISGLFFAPAN
ncbi:MAG: DUF3887 domain-containing protein [Deltaproteobacteria bacterium]|nr:DUF3887 domain-containing protein [Deltaproteobacteria bacterium]